MRGIVVPPREEKALGEGEGIPGRTMAMLAITAAAGSMTGLTLLVLTDLLILAVLIADHLRIEGRPSTDVHVESDRA